MTPVQIGRTGKLSEAQQEGHFTFREFFSQSNDRIKEKTAMNIVSRKLYFKNEGEIKAFQDKQRTSLIAQLVKNLPAMQQTLV